MKKFIERIRNNSDVPLAVGFGISTPDQVAEVSALAEGVVVGSAIIQSLEGAADKSPEERAKALETFIGTLAGAIATRDKASRNTTRFTKAAPAITDISARNFGDYGGRYIPETLANAHRDLEIAYAAALADPAFIEEVAWYRKEFIGGPTPLYFAKNLTAKVGGANIWFKREELAHTGAHKINNAVGQALLAKRLGKKKIIAETGAGQHGVATAAVCAQLGMECTIYMVRESRALLLPYLYVFFHLSTSRDIRCPSFSRLFIILIYLSVFCSFFALCNVFFLYCNSGRSGL